MPLPDDLAKLTDAELLNELWGCYSDLLGSSGEVRNLLWDQILEIQGELRRRYPPITDPRQPPSSLG